MERILVFDFDGTLIDSMGHLADIAVKHLNSNYGLSPAVSKELYFKTSGLPFVEQIELIFPNNVKNAETVVNFEREKEETIFDQPLYPEVKEVLGALSNQGYKLVISSSNSQPIIEQYCSEKGLMVDLILGFREGFGKGKDHFNYIKKHFAVPFSKIIFVGDSLQDHEKAVANEIAFIGRIGTFSADDFQEAGAKHTVNSLVDLTELLEKFFNGA